MNCIETKNLSHYYSHDQAVIQQIDLAVPKGAIYGFLGPNGAGKTTTIRLLLGLLKLQKGTISIFGEDVQSNRIKILSRIGSLIETPSLYSHLTAHENLAIHARLFGIKKDRIKEVLDLTGLANTGKKTAGKFSLGMKQRLSLAIALYHNPELLILDEPTNGLDPNGIIEIRELLMKLNAEKKTTILISSHILTEIEKMVSHVGIIHQGTLKFQGSLQELQSKRNSGNTLSLFTSDSVAAKRIAEQCSLSATIIDNKIQFTTPEHATTALLVKKLVDQNIDVYRIEEQHQNLENIFMNLIN